MTKASHTKTAQTKAERDAAKMAVEIIAIADDVAGDFIEKENAKGQVQVVPDRENIARAKLRIDVRMWLMARIAPHIYGTQAAKPAPPGPAPFDIEVDLETGA
jgi:hypothetical protein